MNVIKLNTQRPEPRVKGDGLTLDFHSMFFTIQGEGPFAGHRAIFVRLAGCNLQCPGCDTEYTQHRAPWLISKIIERVAQLAYTNDALGCLVVITGGEPTRQPIGLLVEALVMAGYYVQIESNGVLPLDEHLAFVLEKYQRAYLVISPKTANVDPRAASLAAAFKYVLDYRSVDKTDYLPIQALSHPVKGRVARPPVGTPVYVNPFDSGDSEINKQNLQMAARVCMLKGYVLGVQLHKLVGLE